jgi:hypothetical protein
MALGRSRPVAACRRRAWRCAALLALALGGTYLAGSPASAVDQVENPDGSTTLTFGFTGGPQSWTVPAGVTQATFDLYGGQGAQETFNGGWGGRAMATIALTPGTVVQVMVGGMGQRSTSSSPAQCVLAAVDPHHGAGGFNGGGDGGLGCTSAGGGGASDVRVGGSALGNRVLVAGGGGGGSGNLFCTLAGSGGGLQGGSGQCDGGGAGGTQSITSGSGLFGVGSIGADQEGLSGAGGGGGGGYVGGAGGNPGLAGGGGSGFGPADTQFQNGVEQGNGRILVTFGGAPTVTGIEPNSGAVGNPVIIHGTGFTDQTSVTFGGVPAPEPVCTSSTECVVDIPPGSGTVGVRVTVNGQLSLDTPADDFTYLPPPRITSISPTTGPPETLLTIAGEGFVTTPGYTFASFGDSSLIAIDCPSSTQCTATVPREIGIGSVDVVVTAITEASNAVTFVVLPNVTSVVPGSGPPSGGTVVTITGTGFSPTPGATTVAFGTVNASAVGCANTTTCTAVSPPGTGTVEVRVTTNGLQSQVTPLIHFTYTGVTEEPPASPSERLAALETALRQVRGVGPALASLVGRAGDAVDDRHPAVACGLLRTFETTVRVLRLTRQLTTDQAAQFTEEATGIRAALGCR